MQDDILEPLESYNKIYKDKFNEVTTNYFDELVSIFMELVAIYE